MQILNPNKIDEVYHKAFFTSHDRLYDQSRCCYQVKTYRLYDTATIEGEPEARRPLKFGSARPRL